MKKKVPSNYRDFPKLGNYVRNVRQNYRYEKEGIEPNRIMSAEERKGLDDMGFEWTIPKKHREYWQNLAELKKFKVEFGHCNVPDTHEDKELVSWCKKLRAKPPGKKRLGVLTEIGFQVQGDTAIDIAAVQHIDSSSVTGAEETKIVLDVGGQ